MKWCFNETDNDENRIVGWHRRYARFDVFGFLIRGSWARWQRATRALFNHFPEVIAIFCHQMLFPVFWMPFEKCWGILHFQYCRGILQVRSFSSWSGVLMKRIMTKIGSLVGIGITDDLTFSDFWSEASEPVGSEQREHCSTISQRW